MEERENRQEQRTQKRNLHRENISQKKQELQKAQEARQNVHANGSATVGATRSHERPVATPVPKPAQADTVAKPERKRPATSPVIKNAEVKVGKRNCPNQYQTGTAGHTCCQNEPTESNRNHQQCEKINGTENTGQSKTKP